MQMFEDVLSSLKKNHILCQESGQRQVRSRDYWASHGPQDSDDFVQASQQGIHLGDQWLHFDWQGGQRLPLYHQGGQRPRDQDIQNLDSYLQRPGQVCHRRVPFPARLWAEKPKKDGPDLGREGDEKLDETSQCGNPLPGADLTAVTCITDGLHWNWWVASAKITGSQDLSS